jgi:GTP diphosphokinase / guanosine-3',5'-bis(diphosphate) 3'-diphosphatase
METDKNQRKTASKPSILDVIHLMRDHSHEDIELIKKAFNFAELAHKDQQRNSGEPYLVHLVETASILAELGMSSITIAAGLLHDAIEDMSVTQEQIEKDFGKEIAFLVQGVTKLGNLRYKGVNRHNESLRKLFVAMSEDIRVLLIKLADRLHNMRTLEYVPLEKQKRIAQETLEIYAPIAYRLGIRKLHRELEDLAFPYVYPLEYEEMRKAIRQRHSDRSEGLEKFSRSTRKALAKEKIINFKTEYRVKGLYSLYKKLLRKDRDIDNVYDISAMRILVDSIADCYRVLGLIHSRWRPLPKRIKDYIAFPKPNGYQGVHTTVFTGDGNIVEVQIKTYDMHKHSEYGIASHITYKEKNKNRDALKWVHSLLPKESSLGERQKSMAVDVPNWIKELAQYEEPNKNQKKFRERLTSDFFNHRIFVFSPTGDVVDLPINSTPIDFAYAIHSDIGNHIFGAKVNGKLESLETKLKNGDIVEIMTKESAVPTQKWLDVTVTSLAKRNIRSELVRLKKFKR